MRRIDAASSVGAVLIRWCSVAVSLCALSAAGVERCIAPDVGPVPVPEAAVPLFQGFTPEPVDLPDSVDLSYERMTAPAGRHTVFRPILRNVGENPVHLADVRLFVATLRRPPQESKGYERLRTFRDNDVWYESTYWQGGHSWCRVGRNWQHPGEQMASVRRFALPRRGTVSVRGPVRALHRGGDGTDVRILHNGIEVWRRFIGGADTEGAEPDLSLTVRGGDALRFVVSQHGSIACDTTFWDPVIAYAADQTFRASEGFSGTQGQNGWFYERYEEEPPPAPPPVLRQIADGFSIRPFPAAEDMAGGQPVFVLAAPDDRSGLAVAVDCERGCSLRFDAAAANSPGRVELIRHGPLIVPPRGELVLPALVLIPYAGRWTGGLLSLLEYLRPGEHAAALSAAGRVLDASRRAFRQRVDEPLRDWLPDPDLWLLVQAEWLREDRIDSSEQSLCEAVRVHLREARSLLERRPDSDAAFVQSAPRLLDEIGAGVDRFAEDRTRLEALYLKCRLLKRALFLSHPLLRIDRLLFCKRRQSRWSHLVMQYFGFRARRGGGIFVLERPGLSLQVTDIVGGQLPPGSFLEPRLSYDGTRVVFSYVECGDTELDASALVQNEHGDERGYFHVYEIGVDGTGLRRLTSGTYDDTMPNYLPDGGIVFCSTRRKGYSRCFGPNYSRRWHSYTVHRMNPDGSDIRILSHNDVSEWFPAVSNSGRIVFARWDYIDRHAVLHQNLWAMRPDGTNQVALWGNGAPRPHCTFQIQPIPQSGKFAFIASAHHALTGGPLCLVDPSVDSNSQEAVRRITPQPFPEAEGWRLPDYYEFAWPLSEHIFLVGYSDRELRSQGRSYKDPTPDHALGIYALDDAGNRELLYRDPFLNSTTPIPLRPRPRPPVLAGTLADAEDGHAEVVLTEVRRGLGDSAAGLIREIRVVQVFPKTTPWANSPRIGFAGEENARAVLGTVPVAADGSARFLVPAGKLLLFQALDANGDAYQVMRSTTSFKAGERTSCIGCHENRMNAPPTQRPLAMNKPPAALQTSPFEGRPFNYMTVVQPIWDTHCISCHGGETPKKGIDLTAAPKGGFARSYWSLCGDPRTFDGRRTNPETAASELVPRFGQRNTIDVTEPGGTYGARGSRLMAMLRDGHAKVDLSDAELRRIAMWIDLNAVFYGAYLDERREQQLAGHELDMPEIE